MNTPDIVFLKKSEDSIDGYLPIIETLRRDGFKVTIHPVINDVYLDEDTKADLHICSCIMSYGQNGDFTRLLAEDLIQSWIIIDPDFQSSHEDQWTFGLILCSSPDKIPLARKYSNKPIIDLTQADVFSVVDQFINQL